MAFKTEFSRVSGPSVFALQVALHAVAIGALAFLAIYLFVETQLYATALLVAAGAFLIGLDLIRVVSHADRTMERFLEGLAIGASEAPARSHSGFARLPLAIEKTARALTLARTRSEREVEYLQSLLDTVSAALFVADTEGHVKAVNRAAHSFAQVPVERFSDIAALGHETASALSVLTPGARKIMRLADGRQALAAVAKFSVPSTAPQRLISLQRIAGELDAVELKAWHDVSRVLAHEMMNSLTPIASLSENLEGLLSLGRQDDALGAVEAIKRRSTGLMAFVERYRKIAELPAPEMRAIPLSPFLAGIERFMRASFAEKKIQFVCSVQADVTILGDPHLLEQAVINLLRNAIDAVSEAKEPLIDLSSEVANGQATISVMDNGRGLTPADTEEIFVPFFTTKAGGSGIGLSLVRQIALAHSGRAEAKSTTPQGAVFRIILPIDDSERLRNA